MKLKKLLTVISIFLAIPILLNAEKIQFSIFTENEKIEALKTSSIVLDNLSQHNYDSLKQHLTKNEVNFGGYVWMPVEQYLSFIKALTSKNYTFKNLKIYDFDDIENKPNLKSYAISMNQIFNNFSLMLLADAEDKTNNEKTTVGLILIKNNKTKKWEVASIFGFNAKSHIINANKLQSEYNTVSIKKIGIEFPLHKSFEQMQLDPSQFNYFMKGKTPRDSAVQIVYIPKEDNLLLVSLSWVKFNLQNRKFSPPVMSYFLNGYKYECQITGSDCVIRLTLPGNPVLPCHFA